jgi:hypothetical protein
MICLFVCFFNAIVQDDADETGSTPHRIVPASHIIKLPLA